VSQNVKQLIAFFSTAFSPPPPIILLACGSLRVTADLFIDCLRQLGSLLLLRFTSLHYASASHVAAKRDRTSHFFLHHPCSTRSAAR